MKMIVLCLFGVWLAVPGASAEPLPNSLASLVAEAVRNNPEVRFFTAEITAAAAARSAAGRLAQPELSAELGHKSSRDNTGLHGDGAAWSVSVMQTFEWPGRMALRKAVANCDLKLAELALQQFRAELARRVRLAAWNLWAARQQWESAITVQRRFDALREVLIQRDPAGVAPALELRVIEATALGLRKRVTDAEVAVQQFGSELNLLSGRPAATEVFVEDASLRLGQVPALGELLALARTNNLELQLKSAELEQQGFKVDLIRHERFPSLSFGPVISEERSLDRDRIIGLRLTMPLPLWRRNAANVAAAEARRTQAEALLQSTLRAVERQLTLAAQTYGTKWAEIQRWHPAAIDEFRQAAALADRHYQLGAVPVTTYVELQRQYVEAVAALLALHAEALQAAGELEQAAGRELNLVTLQPARE